MKRHQKTQKMSRIRVAAFKKRQKMRKIKKSPLGLASLDYKKSVTNCTIKKVKSVPDVEWEDKKHPQPKSMMKKHTEWVYNKETHEVDKVTVPSTFPTKKYKDVEKKLWKNLGKAAKMEAYAQDKLKKWEQKHPRPCANDDLFKDEMIPIWKAEREQALERFRDFVVSVYDKLHIVGNRVDRKNGKVVGKTVAEVKDIDGKGHNVNYPNLQESDRLYKDATKAAQDAMNKDSSIVDCDLKNHKGDQKRPLIHAKRGKAKTQTLKQHKEMRKAA